MEKMALHLFAAWTELQSLMKDSTLLALEGEAAQQYADRAKYADDYLLKEYKKVVRRVWGVAFPQLFSAFYREAKEVRDKLAHMIDIDAVKGDQPHRVMTIVRSNGFEKYEDGVWLQHRYQEEIREEDLREALSDLVEARKMLHIIFHLGVQFKEQQPSNDDIWDFHWVTWWDDRWGEAPTHPTKGYKAPVGRFRHHLDPKAERAYWDPDGSKYGHYQHDEEDGDGD